MLSAGMLMSDALDLMPFPERAKRYRELSSRALQDALDSPPGRMRDGYVSLALGWASLAENYQKLIEEESNKDTARPDTEAAPPELPEQGRPVRDARFFHRRAEQTARA